MDKLLMIAFGLLFSTFTTATHFIGGDGFIELGTFRLGNVDNTHFSISSISGTKGPKTVIIFRSDGTVHEGPRDDYDLDNKPLLDEPTNIRFSEHGIEFGDYWCIGMSENDYSDGYDHLSISHNNKDGDNIPKTAMIWRNDGTRHKGSGRTDFSCWASNTKNDVTFGDEKSYIQFNNAYRIGTTGLNGDNQEHLSIASDRTIVIYRDDGTIHPGPRDDYAWPDWDPDHSECSDCDNSDGCSENHCSYSTGTAVCIKKEKTCPPNKVCSSDENKCVRDCNSFAIDEYLTQCSIFWNSDQIDIALLQSELAALKETVINNNNDATQRLDGIDTNIGSINDDTQYIHERIDGFGPSAKQIHHTFITDNTSQNYKDIFIIALLLINTITIIGSCYIYKKNNNQKKYHIVNMQQSDDEEIALNK